MNKIIIINGTARSGKDTFVEIFTTFFKGFVFNKSTVEDVKKIAIEMGWNGIKDDLSRKFLSDIKDLWTNYNNGIFEKLKNFCYKNMGNDVVIFIHCREPEEIQKFKDEFKNNCTTLFIKRDICEIYNNHADQNVSNYNYDITIENNSTLDDYINLIKELINKYNYERRS